MPLTTLDPRYKAKVIKQWMDRKVDDMDIDLGEVSRRSGVSYQVISNHRRDGKWTLDQFRGIIQSLEATDAEIVKLLKGEKT